MYIIKKLYWFLRGLNIPYIKIRKNKLLGYYVVYKYKLFSKWIEYGTFSGEIYEEDGYHDYYETEYFNKKDIVNMFPSIRQRLS